MSEPTGERTWREWFEGCQQARADADATIAVLRRALREMLDEADDIARAKARALLDISSSLTATAQEYATRHRAEIEAPWREMVRELLDSSHQTGLLRDHTDSTRSDTWIIGDVSTCEDSLCREARSLLDADKASEGTK